MSANTRTAFGSKRRPSEENDCLSFKYVLKVSLKMESSVLAESKFDKAHHILHYGLRRLTTNLKTYALKTARSCYDLIFSA